MSYFDQVDSNCLHSVDSCRKSLRRPTNIFSDETCLHSEFSTVYEILEDKHAMSSIIAIINVYCAHLVASYH